MGTKYDSFASQRELCRNNGRAYTEKIALADGYKMPVLFCNYPFPDPEHKKGLCVAKTCTDLRKKAEPKVEPVESITTDATGRDKDVEQINSDGDETVNSGEETCPENVTTFKPELESAET